MMNFIERKGIEAFTWAVATLQTEIEILESKNEGLQRMIDRDTARRLEGGYFAQRHQEEINRNTLTILSCREKLITFNTLLKELGE